MSFPESEQSYAITSPKWLRTFALRFVFASIGWWIISEGQTAALAVGVPAAVAATALSLVLAPPARHLPRPLGLLLFAGYFLRRSIIAGIDVARFILAPTPRYQPAISQVTLHIPQGGPRWLLADSICLLPGSVCVDVDDNILTLHRLNHTGSNADVREVERQIARLFDLKLDIPDE